MRSPKVSVIIPAYNRAHLIGLTLQSVRAQAYSDFEIVVIDDGSKDDTGRVVRETAPEARYIWQENVGLPEVLNVCVRAARGEYVSFMGSDDAMLPGALERQARALDQNPSVGMVHGAAWLMDDGGSLTSVARPSFAAGDYVHDGRQEIRRLLISNHIIAPTVMARRRCFDEVGLFKPDLRLYEDWDMWMRILRRWDIAYVDDPITCYRVHLGEAGSVSLTADPRVMERCRSVALNAALAGGDSSIPSQTARRIWARHFYAIAEQAFYMGDMAYGIANAFKSIGRDPFGAQGRSAIRLLMRHFVPAPLVHTARRVRRNADSGNDRGNVRPTVEAVLRGAALPEQ